MADSNGGSSGGRSDSRGARTGTVGRRRPDQLGVDQAAELLDEPEQAIEHGPLGERWDPTRRQRSPAPHDGEMVRWGGCQHSGVTWKQAETEIRRLGAEDEDAVLAAAALFDRPPDR